jgi:hypothetical protein
VASEDGIVHVHGGRSLLDDLAVAGIAGGRQEWSDPISCGPCPDGLAPEDWYRTRASYLATTNSALDVTAVQDRLREQDRALMAIPVSTEIVIWSGPELFCQAILMRLLQLLGTHRKISLVDPGDQPGIPGCPMGRLSAAQLVHLYQQRRPATDEALTLARQAWTAFTAPDARLLVTLVAGDTSALPHLGAALARHLADLPDGATGLSTTETRLLQVLEEGPRDLSGLLTAMAAKEPRPFLTDDWLNEILQRLGAGAGPLLTLAGGDKYSLTARGRDVLAGHDFWTAERWHGGILIREQDDEDGGSDSS